MRWCAWFFYRAEKSATSLDKNKVTPLLSALAELNQIRIGCQRITAIGEFTIIRNICYSACGTYSWKSCAQGGEKINVINEAESCIAFLRSNCLVCTPGLIQGFGRNDDDRDLVTKN